MYFVEITFILIGSYIVFKLLVLGNTIPTTQFSIPTTF